MFPSTPFILVIGLTVATCVIAYWSDNLGKKLGKKRLSLFGLRPRQTATAISMATSVGIMALTLIALLTFSVSLRNALLNYDRLRHDANILRRQVALVQEEAHKAGLQRLKAEADLKATGLQLEKSKRNARYAEVRSAQVKTELKGAQASLNAARFAEASARRGQTAARREQATARRGEQAARQGETNALASQHAAQRGLVLSKRLFASTRFKLDRAGKELHSQSEALSRVKEAAKRIGATADSVGRQNTELIARREQLSAKINDLQKLQAALEKLSDYAAHKVDVYGGIVGLLGAGKIAAQLGTPFAETRLAASSEPARVRVALRDLLENGAEEAGRLGAHPFVAYDDGVSRALHLAPIYAGQPGKENQLGESVQIEQLANYLSTYKIPVSIRLSAARSFAEGETEYFARLEIVPIKRAFVSGETITSTTMDGNVTDAQLFNSLLSLVNAGEVVARQRGMSPVITKDNPDFYAVGTNERIFDALRDVQMQSRQVRVRLLAAEDATTVDNLRVRFVIEGLPT